MAENTAIIRMRLLTWEEAGSCVGSNINVPNSVTAGEPKILDIHVEGTPTDAAGFVEIDPVTGHLLEDPAVAIGLLSADNKDNSSGTGCVEGVYTIGIDENDEIVTRLETMHAVTGTTLVVTTNLYKEMFHCYASSHGSDASKDAEGNITTEDIATNDIAIITAAGNESDGSAFKVPAGHCAMLLHCHLKRLAPTAAVYSSDEGVRIRIIYIDPIDGETGLVAGDRAANWITLEVVGAYDSEAHHAGGEIFEEGTWIHHQHSSKVDLGELYDLHVKYLIWKK